MKLLLMFLHTMFCFGLFCGISLLLRWHIYAAPIGFWREVNGDIPNSLQAIYIVTYILLFIYWLGFIVNLNDGEDNKK